MAAPNFANDTRGADEPGEGHGPLEPTADPEKFRCQDCGTTVHVSEDPQEAHSKSVGGKKIRR